jgi:hypothetical protein
MIQNDQSQGKGQNIDHTPQSDGLAAFEIAKGRQRNIDEQTQRTHADTKDMLNDGADTIDSGGRKLIGEHEQLIVHRSDHTHTGNDEIGQNFSEFCHIFSPVAVGNIPCDNYYKYRILLFLNSKFYHRSLFLSRCSFNNFVSFFFLKLSEVCAGGIHGTVFPTLSGPGFPSVKLLFFMF